MEKKFLGIDAITEIDGHIEELLEEYNLPFSVDEIYEKEGFDPVNLHQYLNENKDTEHIKELTKFIKNNLEYFLKDENAVLGIGSPVPTPPTREPFKERHPKLNKLRNLLLAGAVTLTGASAAYAAAPNDTKEKIEDITKQISKGIPEIPVLTHIGLDDRDHDGVLSYKDKYPDTYNFPAQKFAREIGLSDEIVSKLSPLDSGYVIEKNIANSWCMAKRQPELDIREKEFIENLKNYNSDIQNKLVKFAQDKRITNRELSIIKNLYNLDPEIQNLILDTIPYNKEYFVGRQPAEYDSDFISLLSNFDESEQEKLIKAFLDDKKISLDELVQTKFLENNKQFLKNEEFKNFDLDGDNMNNYFETLSDLYNPYVKNDRYFIIVDTIGGYTTDLLSDFKLNEKIPDENLILLKGKNASALNLRNAIMEVGKKADSNDFVYIFLNGHGQPGVIHLYWPQFDGNQEEIDKYMKEYNSDPDVQDYERLWKQQDHDPGNYLLIDKWLDRHLKNPKAVCIFVDACHSGSALPSMKDGPCPRVVMTSTTAKNLSGIGFDHIFYKIMLDNDDNAVKDLDNNSYPSLYEFFRSMYESHKDRIINYYNDSINNIPKNKLNFPQLSDPYDISNKLYFGDYTWLDTKRYLYFKNRNFRQ